MTQHQSRPAPAEALTPAQRATLAAALNQIVPARDALPGAGDLGVAAAIERTLAGAPALLRLFLDGLRAIDLAAGDAAFADLPGGRQEALLRDVEAAQPAFFAALVEHTYRGYYTLPAVQRGLGLSGEPPQPRGHRLAPFDPALLAVQRQRAPFWRQTE